MILTLSPELPYFIVSEKLKKWSSIVLDEAYCCELDSLGLWLRVRNIKIFPYFSTKTYVVGALKYRLNETVLLCTQNMLKIMGKKIFTILRRNFFLVQTCDSMPVREYDHAGNTTTTDPRPAFGTKRKADLEHRQTISCTHWSR